MKYRILVDEEYGYRFWLWEPEQENAGDLYEHFDDRIEYLMKVNDPSKCFSGSWEPLTDKEWKEIREGGTYEGSAHVHDPDTSQLYLSGHSLNY